MRVNVGRGEAVAVGVDGVRADAVGVGEAISDDVGVGDDGEGGNDGEGVVGNATGPTGDTVHVRVRVRGVDVVPTGPGVGGAAKYRNTR